MNLFVFGLGYSAQALIRARPWSKVAGTVRTREKAARLQAEGIEAFSLDDEPDMARQIAQADAILVSTPPSEGIDPTITSFAPLIASARKGTWLGYLSTTGVYGDHGGGWVDETVPPDPRNTRSIHRVRAESQWLDLGERAGLNAAVFRLSGIYGPGRNAFVALAKGKAQRIVKPGQVSNRIHVEDIAGVLAASVDRPRAGAVYNVSDHEPAPPQDIIAFAAELAGLPPLPDIPVEDADLSPMSESFYAENKRISNGLITRELAVQLRYPTYREGLSALFAQGEAAQTW